jgi:hypothetical protein
MRYVYGYLDSYTGDFASEALPFTRTRKRGSTKIDYYPKEPGTISGVKYYGQPNPQYYGPPAPFTPVNMKTTRKKGSTKIDYYPKEPGTVTTSNYPARWSIASDEYEVPMKRTRLKSSAKKVPKMTSEGNVKPLISMADENGFLRSLGKHKVALGVGALGLGALGAGIYAGNRKRRRRW